MTILSVVEILHKIARMPSYSTVPFSRVTSNHVPVGFSAARGDHSVTDGDGGSRSLTLLSSNNSFQRVMYEVAPENLATDVIQREVGADLDTLDLAEDLARGVELARTALSSGKARPALDRLVEVSNG